MSSAVDKPGQKPITLRERLEQVGRWTLNNGGPKARKISEIALVLIGILSTIAVACLAGTKFLVGVGALLAIYLISPKQPDNR